MDRTLQQEFAERWGRYFPTSELPIAFFFADDPEVEPAPPPRGWRCIFPSLAPVRRGRPLAFGVESLGCQGAKSQMGFVRERTPDLDLFLSCGVPGGRPGLRLKAGPELVRASQARFSPVAAAGRYLVAKRWDQLDERDDPAVVTFFVRPDALAALVTLSCFDRDSDEDGAACPSVAGCSAIFARPLAERGTARPRCFVGLFDLTPRQYLAADEMTFSAPFERFRELAAALPRSLVSTEPWTTLSRRS